MAADAGRFDEQVSPALAMSSINACFHTVAVASGEKSVTQVAGRGVVGHLGGATLDFVPRTRKLLLVRFGELLLRFA